MPLTKEEPCKHSWIMDHITKPVGRYIRHITRLGFKSCRCQSPLQTPHRPSGTLSSLSRLPAQLPPRKQPSPRLLAHILVATDRYQTLARTAAVSKKIFEIHKYIYDYLLASNEY